MLYVVFVLADSLYRTCFLAWYRNIYDSMIRTALMTDTAAYTSVVVNTCLTCFLVEMYSTFRAVHVAASCHTTSTQVTYFIVYLNA